MKCYIDDLNDECYDCSNQEIQEQSSQEALDEGPCTCNQLLNHRPWQKMLNSVTETPTFSRRNTLSRQDCEANNNASFVQDAESIGAITSVENASFEA